MRKHCTAFGAIGTIPEIPGILVFLEGHVGVYIGDGYVIEAKGHKYGVVKTKLKERPWLYWGKCEWIDYTESVKKVTTRLPLLKKGMKGLESIKTLQRQLNVLGFKDSKGSELVIDGSFGPATDYAVRALQKANNLTVDGQVGQETWPVVVG